MRTAILFSFVTAASISSVFAADMAAGSARFGVVPDIQGGTLTTQWPSVGAIYAGSSGLIDQACTGTLIAPRWVLTAAHCVRGSSQFAFLLGGDVSSYWNNPSNTMPPVNVDAAYSDAQFNLNNPSAGHDIGLLHLSADLSLLAFKVNTQAFSNTMIGWQVAAMGYGLTSPVGQTFGVKYMVDLPITSYTATDFQEGGTNMGTCEGDSGGPEFVLDSDGFPVIVGVTSYGSGTACAGSFAQRVDTEIGYIESVVGSGVICRDGETCDGIFRDGLDAPANSNELIDPN